MLPYINIYCLCYLIGYVESDVSESNSVIIKLRPPNIDGVRYKLDSETSFKSCTSALAK